MQSDMIVDSRAMIDPNTPYVVVDRQTGQIVYRTTYARRRQARAYADRRDNQYGAYRYSAMPLAQAERALAARAGSVLGS